MIGSSGPDKVEWRDFARRINEIIILDLPNMHSSHRKEVISKELEELIIAYGNSRYEDGRQQRPVSLESAELYTKIACRNHAE